MPSPAKLKFNWKSDDKCFGFYNSDGESAESRKGLKKLPFKFLVMDVVHAVGGFDDKKEVGLWSPEFRSFNEKITVRYNKGGEIATGVWKEIKDTVVSKGGYMQVVAYILLKNGEIAKLELKGAAYFALNEYIGKIGNRVYDEFVQCSSFSEGKKGSVSYSTPEFESGGVIDADFDILAEEAYKSVAEYLKAKIGNGSADEPQEESSSPENSSSEPVDAFSNQGGMSGEEEDLPF